jgi:hypothetical protein
MRGEAPGKSVIERELGSAARLAQDLVRGEAEELAQVLEVLDSQSCPATQDIADGPVAEAKQALGLALGDSGVGEALPQGLDDGSFERTVAKVVQVDLLMVALTGGTAGDGGGAAGARPLSWRAA